jgi:hypothetical protein
MHRAARVSSRGTPEQTNIQIKAAEKAGDGHPKASLKSDEAAANPYVKRA